MKKLHKNTKT